MKAPFLSPKSYCGGRNSGVSPTLLFLRVTRHSLPFMSLHESPPAPRACSAHRHHLPESKQITFFLFPFRSSVYLSCGLLHSRCCLLPSQSRGLCVHPNCVLSLSLSLRSAPLAAPASIFPVVAWSAARSSGCFLGGGAGRFSRVRALVRPPRRRRRRRRGELAEFLFRSAPSTIPHRRRRRRRRSRTHMVGVMCIGNVTDCKCCVRMELMSCPRRCHR